MTTLREQRDSILRAFTIALDQCIRQAHEMGDPKPILLDMTLEIRFASTRDVVVACPSLDFTKPLEPQFSEMATVLDAELPPPVIVVNGTRVSAPAGRLTYEWVTRYVYGKEMPGVSVICRVPGMQSRTLSPGEAVDAVSDMIVNACRTSNA